MGADNFRSILLKQVIVGVGKKKTDNNLDEHHACIIPVAVFVRQTGKKRKNCFFGKLLAYQII